MRPPPLTKIDPDSSAGCLWLPNWASKMWPPPLEWTFCSVLAYHAPVLRKAAADKSGGALRNALSWVCRVVVLRNSANPPRTYWHWQWEAARDSSKDTETRVPWLVAENDPLLQPESTRTVIVMGQLSNEPETAWNVWFKNNFRHRSEDLTFSLNALNSIRPRRLQRHCGNTSNAVKRSRYRNVVQVYP